VTAPALDPILAGLNDEQRAAVAHPGGPLLVVAGAGTGKTRTLVHRVAALLARGVRPERVLLLTFTRRAAQEMLQRVERLVGAPATQVQGGTFHATAHRLLRRFGEQAGIAPGFTILDQGDAVDLMQLARSASGIAPKEKRFARKETLHAVYSRHVNTDIPVATLLADEWPQFADDAPAILRIFGDYVRRKGERNLVDYDDLLLFWAAMLEGDAGLAARIAALFDHVLVDEYQDTNPLQARILRALCAPHGNLTVVGDDAQSIYAFRGATVRNILDFPAQWPGATVITLDRNYRSTQPILDTANAVLAQAREGYRKVLRTDRTEGERPWLVPLPDEPAQVAFVVDRLLELHEGEGIPLRRMAILVRAGHMSGAIEIELAARRIPFEKWGGLRFLEAAHVKDVLAFLRVTENPRDEVSWFRLLQLLPGIGEATARAAVARLEQGAWTHAALVAWRPPPRAAAAHTALVALLAGLHAGTGDAGTDIATVRALYDDILRDRYDDAPARLADLAQLAHIAATYPGRGAFLSALALDPPTATSDLARGGDGEDDVLVISTVHSAKGKEWDVVFVPWATDGAFPMARALRDPAQEEEERRLFYVAVTRARHRLHVAYPLFSPWSGGREQLMGQCSRFIDAAVAATMTRVAVQRPDDAPPTERPAPAVLDVRALLRNRFT
jgi:DNA helicase-2/ATP-dependent DNA helicase PcrA